MKGTRGLSGVGEIVQVQGGHILRPTGPKDRHSKIYTSKGPKDRRVRLSAHTAIKFFDVQDRLGYDRSTRAVDWLINKAKAAIDELNNNNQLTLVEQQTETPYVGYPLLQANNNNMGLSNQGNFQRMDNGWNRDGFVMNTQEISQQGLLFSHELPVSDQKGNASFEFSFQGSTF